METKVVKIDSNQIDQNKMKDAAEIIAQGGLVAFPTETVYGLGADALHPEASMKIYAAKGRPSDNPLIVHIAKFEDLESIAKEVPEQARKLAAEAVVYPEAERNGIHPFTPAGAGIARAILAEDDEQHLGQLARGDGVLRAERALTVAGDDAALGAEADVEIAPRAGRVGEGREILSLRIVGAEPGDDLRNLLARDRRSRAERTICITGDQPEIDQHPDCARIADLCLIEKYLFGRRGRCRRQHARRQDQKNGQTKSKHPFHDVFSPFHTLLNISITKRSFDCKGKGQDVT